MFHLVNRKGAGSTRKRPRAAGPAGRRSIACTSKGSIALPTVMFHRDRAAPGTSCAPILAALSAATPGFDVTFGRTDPDVPPPSPVNMMPDFPPGVDVLRHGPDGVPSGPSAECARRPAEGSTDPHVLRILDVPLPGPRVAWGAGVATVDCLVAESMPLSHRRGAPAPIRITYNAIGRNGLHCSWDDVSSCWRINVPALTDAEIASTSRGTPLPRPRAVADVFARVLLGSVEERRAQPSAHACPMAARRPAEVRNRPPHAMASR